MRRLSQRRSVQSIGLLALILSLAASPARAQERSLSLDDVESDAFVVPGQELAVEKLLEDWGMRLGHTVVAHPNIEKVTVTFQSAEVRLTWGMVKRVLSAYGVAITEEELAPGQLLIRAYARRRGGIGGGQAFPPSPPFRFVEPEGPLPRRSEVVTAVIPVRNGAGREAFTALRFLQQQYRDPDRLEELFYVAGSDIMIAIGPAPRVAYYRELARTIDRRAPGQELRMRQLKVADAEELAGVLGRIIEGGAARPSQQAPPSITAHKPTRTLIIKAYDYQLAEIEALITELDVRVDPDKEKYHVYKCRNANAKELAAKLQELAQVDIRKRNQPGSSRRPDPRSRGARQGPETPKRVDLRIVADDGINALLIQAEDEDFREVMKLLRRLDQKRRRVFIEAMVWELSASDNLTFAAELAALSRPADGSARPLAATSFGLSDITVDQGGVGRNVVNRLGQGITAVLTKDRFSRVPVIISALNQVSRTRSVTTPYTVTNDNQQVVFRAVSRQPFTVTDIGNFFARQNVNFLEAPTSLDVLPQVNSSDSVTLDLNLEVATFGLRGSPNLPPPVLQRRYSGRVTVPNGQFVVFGGLDQTSDIVSESKVPFVGDIPLLGHLFKSWRRTKVKTSVYSFIRPLILTDKGFRDDLRLGELFRKKAHSEAGREAWLPPIIARPGDRALDLQDKVFEVFGTGSGNPFR